MQKYKATPCRKILPRQYSCQSKRHISRYEGGGLPAPGVYCMRTFDPHDIKGNCASTSSAFPRPARFVPGIVDTSVEPTSFPSVPISRPFFESVFPRSDFSARRRFIFLSPFRKKSGSAPIRFHFSLCRLSPSARFSCLAIHIIHECRYCRSAYRRRNYNMDAPADEIAIRAE